MRTAVQWEALAEIFSGRCDIVMMSTVLSSRISVTEKVLALYRENLGSNQQFQAWFSSASQHRISVHAPTLSPRKVKAVDLITDDYGTATYYGGSNLVAHVPILSVSANSGFESIGTKIIPVTDCVDFPIEGDNPIYTIGTESGGALDFDVLGRFISPEERVVIYDKFINQTSIQLLEYIARTLSDGSYLYLFHTFQAGKNLLDSLNIHARLTAANSKINVKCTLCSQNFKKLEHDRYLFLGDRLQIVFTAGLDCFGDINSTTGRRNNRRSKINFYDVTRGEDLCIEGKDGSAQVVKCIARM